MLFREPKRKPTAVESIDRLQLHARFKQLGNFVGNVFNVLKCVFARFLLVQYEHKKEITLGPEAVLDIGEVTDELAWVVTAGRLGTEIGAKEQRQVKGCFVGAINDRRFLTKSVEVVPAVSALAGISLHRNTPCPASIIAAKVTERSANRQKLRIPKPSLATHLQLIEKARAPEANLGVRTVLRTGLAH
jgi:hypothetical protein